MYTYRIVLNVINATESAQVVTYSQGHTPDEALRRINTIYVGRDGSVSDGINPWPGNVNLPDKGVRSRHFQEWRVVRMRTVPKVGTPRVLASDRA